MESPVLTGWKEIAAYLHIDQQTARVWTKVHNLPIKKIGYGAVTTTINLLQLWILEQDVMTPEDTKKEKEEWSNRSKQQIKKLAEKVM